MQLQTCMIVFQSNNAWAPIPPPVYISHHHCSQCPTRHPHSTSLPDSWAGTIFLTLFLILGIMICNTDTKRSSYLVHISHPGWSLQSSFTQWFLLHSNCLFPQQEGDIWVHWRNFPQYSQSHLLQAHSKHHSQWREIKSLPSRLGKRQSCLFSPIKQSTGSSGHSS